MIMTETKPKLVLPLPHFTQWGHCPKCQHGTVTNIPLKKPGVKYFWYCRSCHEGFTFEGKPIGEVRPGRDFGRDFD